MTYLKFDEVLSRGIEATYSTPDVVEQRRATLRALALRPGEDVLDVGSGPGFLAAEMAQEVGPEGTVTGLDPSPSMLALADNRPPTAGAAPVRFMNGEATALLFPDASFDAVTSTQVYEYVADIEAAIAEACRVTRPGGRLLVLDTDWASIVWHSTDPGRMARILAAWDEHLVDPHLPRRLTPLLEKAGFAVTHQSAIPLLNIGYHKHTYSAGLIGTIESFVPGRGGVTQPETRAWSKDLIALGPDYFFSLNRYVFLGVKQPPR